MGFTQADSREGFCCSFSKTPKSRGRGDPAPPANFQGWEMESIQRTLFIPRINKIIKDTLCGVTRIPQLLMDWGPQIPTPSPAAGVSLFPEPASFPRQSINIHSVKLFTASGHTPCSQPELDKSTQESSSSTLGAATASWGLPQHPGSLWMRWLG